MDGGAAAVTGVEKRHDEYEYLDLVRKVMSQGKVKGDRTGQSAVSPAAVRWKDGKHTAVCL